MARRGKRRALTQPAGRPAALAWPPAPSVVLAQAKSPASSLAMALALSMPPLDRQTRLRAYFVATEA